MRQVLAVFLGLLVGAGVVHADNEHAYFNYVMNCQGCHLPDASGAPAQGVPNMKSFLGYFLHSAEGRAFVIRVPGVAAAPLTNDQTAELVNWMLLTYSPDELPDDYQPYTPAEIGKLRADIEADPMRTRLAILHDIAESTPEFMQYPSGLTESTSGTNDR